MTELRTGVRLLLQVGRRGVKFRELAEDALLYFCEHHTDQRNFKQRLELAIGEFALRIADSISLKELGEWLVGTADQREWTAATRNRVKAAISKAFSLGIDNGKVQTIRHGSSPPNARTQAVCDFFMMMKSSGYVVRSLTIARTAWRSSM